MCSNKDQSFSVEQDCTVKINQLFTLHKKLHEELKHAVSLVCVANLDEFTEFNQDIIANYLETLQEKLLATFETSETMITVLDQTTVKNNEKAG